MGKIKYRTLRENVAEEIRNKIIRQEIKPGQRIIENDLAEEFDTSRGPIREALRQLENEGLIEYTRNVGCSVKRYTLEESYEIYLMRANFEILAVKMLKGSVPQKTIKSMERILEKFQTLTIKDYENIVKYDNELHEAIITMIEHPYIHEAWKKLSYGNIAIEYSTHLNKEERMNKQYTSHKLIVDACKEGDCKKICRLISQHYWRTIVRIMSEEESNITPKEDWGYIFEE